MHLCIAVASDPLNVDSMGERTRLHSLAQGSIEAEIERVVQRGRPVSWSVTSRESPRMEMAVIREAAE